MATQRMSKDLFWNSAVQETWLDPVVLALNAKLSLASGPTLDDIVGGEGNDTLTGGAGPDTILGNGGDDTITGSVLNDHLDGGAGNDSIFGLAGNDSMSGGDGRDALFGDAGNDTVNGDDGNDYIQGNLGDDTLSGGTGNDLIYASSPSNSGQDDSGSNRNLLDGGNGRDQLFGANGQDTMNGGADNDTLWGGEGIDWLSGGDGDDLIGLQFSSASDFDLGNDLMDGGTGNDSLFGGLGDDVVFGGDGNDTLEGNEGSDTMQGGTGADQFTGIGRLWQSGSWVIGVTSTLVSLDRVLDFDAAQSDRILFQSAMLITLPMFRGQIATPGFGLIAGQVLSVGDAAPAGQEFWSWRSGTSVFVIGDINGNLALDSSDLVLELQNVPDLILNRDHFVSGFFRAIAGTIGDDTLTGNSAFDTIYGGGGNDYIDGQGSSDFLSGNAGNDRLVGGAGVDSLNGDAGDDTLEGGADNDELNGGSGADTAVYAAARSNFSVVTAPVFGQMRLRVTDLTGSLGSDLPVGIESLRFNNETFAIAGNQQNKTANLDGQAFDDVVFQNISSGQVLFADMRAAGMSGWGMALGSLPAGWVVRETGDGNGDGRADLFVQNTANGSLYYYNLVSAGWGVPGAGWSVVSDNITSDWVMIGLGDVTGDSRSDAIVRNSQTGQILYANFANAPAMMIWGTVGNLGTSWRAVGTGDFDRDGFSDVAVQEIATGLTWYINIDGGVQAAGAAGWGFISGPVGGQSSGWVANAIGDLNGDGFFDVVYQNASSGHVWWVNMAGGSNAGWGVVANGMAGWSVTGTADVDNDGYADVLMRSAEGIVVYANMDAGAFAGWGAVANPGTGWVVV